jgi:hypothetical protein
MENQVFSDAIGQITVIGGMVRLDFVAYSVTEKDANGQYMPVFCQRVIMSPESFLLTAEKVQEAARAITNLAQARERPAPRPSPVAASVPGPQSSNAPKRPFP